MKLLTKRDAAYPLKPWLMKGFTPHHQLSAAQSYYTHTLSSARMVVENAFGRLKGQWHCLMKRNDVDFKMMPEVIAACEIRGPLKPFKLKTTSCNRAWPCVVERWPTLPFSAVTPFQPTSLQWSSELWVAYFTWISFSRSDSAFCINTFIHRNTTKDILCPERTNYV